MNSQGKSNTEILNEVIELIYSSTEGVKPFPADKVFNTFKQFIESDELKEVHAGFQSWTSIKEDMFKQAYVVGGNLYVNYKADGMCFMDKEKIGSSLDNGGLCDVMCLPQGFIVDTREVYDQGEHNRRIWRKHGATTLMSPYSI